MYREVKSGDSHDIEQHRSIRYTSVWRSNTHVRDPFFELGWIQLYWLSRGDKLK